MSISKKYVWLLIFPAIGLAVILLFVRMYHHDVKALMSFMASYNKFDSAISNLENRPASYEFEYAADSSLNELNKNASVRISSLIKNDAELMNTAVETANLSGKELRALKEYGKAVAEKNANSGKFAREFRDLRNKRQLAYARFKQFANPED